MSGLIPGPDEYWVLIIQTRHRWRYQLKLKVGPYGGWLDVWHAWGSLGHARRKADRKLAAFRATPRIPRETT